MPPAQLGRVGWAVHAAARRIPGASCLTQACALYYLMTRAGYEPHIRIGVARNAGGGFESHAWLEYRGRVMLGDIGDLDRFAPILTIPALGAELR